jgi:hypothetical protein
MRPEIEEEDDPSLGELAQQAMREGDSACLSKLQGTAIRFLKKAVDEALATGCEPVWLQDAVLATLKERSGYRCPGCHYFDEPAERGPQHGYNTEG